MIDALTGQMNLFQRLPVQQAPDIAARYAATLGPDRDPRTERAVIREAACLRLLDEVMDWLGDARDRESVLADLIRAADSDGHTFARDLERLGRWHGDSELVDILDGYAGLRYDIERQMVQAWVRGNDIRLQIETGARVRDAEPRHGRPAERVGTVVDRRAETAEYIVQFDDEPHAGPRDGEIVPARRLARLDS